MNRTIAAMRRMELSELRATTASLVPTFHEFEVCELDWFRRLNSCTRSQPITEAAKHRIQLRAPVACLKGPGVMGALP
jgi:hypothetical protein